MNVLYQSTIAILLLVGFESVTALGAEAINPEKDIRRGILLSLIIQGGICYLFEYFAANFVVGQDHGGDRQPGWRRTGYAATRRSGTPAPIGTMLDQVGNIAGSGSGTTISLIVAAHRADRPDRHHAGLPQHRRAGHLRHGPGQEMPSILGLLHGKYATPHGGHLDPRPPSRP